MKRINTILIFVLIAITVFPIIIFSQNKISDKAEREKREVQEFTDSFLKQLEKSKDIAKIPKSFFAPNFPTETLPFKLGIKLPKNTSERLKHKIYTISFNLMYLGMMHLLERVTKSEIEKSESEIDESKGYSLAEEPLVVKFFLPTKTLKLYKQTKILSKWRESDFEILTPEKLRKLIYETETVVNSLRNYLRRHNLPSKKSLFAEQMREVKNIAFWNEGDIYSNVDSNGNKFINVGGFFISLKITKLNGKLKILDILLFEDD